MNRALASEFIGTAFLLMAVVGSGIMGESLAAGNTAVALLANALATGCALYVLISLLGPLSGAQFNPAVSLAMAVTGRMPIAQVPGYLAAQIAGAFTGVWITHAMFGLPIFQVSTTARVGAAQWLSECIATFGLLFVIFGGLRSEPTRIPALVAAWITGAYWFTASTSFANPAVTLARAVTDSFSGIAPAHAPGFIAAQLAGLALALAILPRLFRA